MKGIKGESAKQGSIWYWRSNIASIHQSYIVWACCIPGEHVGNHGATSQYHHVASATDLLKLQRCWRLKWSINNKKKKNTYENGGNKQNLRLHALSWVQHTESKSFVNYHEESSDRCFKEVSKIPIKCCSYCVSENMKEFIMLQLLRKSNKIC